ncbi:MAG TPA: hypothetical protein VF092_14395 [Longimicrobium sp.]
MKQDSPDFLAFQAALESSDEPITEIEIQGRRFIVEPEPEPGVIARMRSAPVSLRSAFTQHFDALEQRPPSYPAWLPFIPGHEVTVGVWDNPEMSAVSWPELTNPDDVIDPLIAQLRQTGWTGAETRTGRGDAPAEFLAFERDGHRCTVIASSADGNWVVILTVYPNP